MQKAKIQLRSCSNFALKMQENIFKFNGFNGFEIQTLPVLGSASAK